jgi:hypothetical protein
MKTLFFFTFICLTVIATAQSQDKKLDSLKNVKSSIQVQIRNLQSELMKVNKQIEAIEQQKHPVSQTTVNGKVTSGGAVLREEPSSMGKTICDIPGGQAIVVYMEQSNLYFKVTYNGKTGYVSYATIEQNQAIDDFLAGKVQEQKNPTSTTIVRKVDEKDPKYQKLLKLYGKDNAVKIMNGEIWNGMSPGMVLESKGKPSSNQTVTDAAGNEDIWNYSNMSIHFKNGEVFKVTKK